MLYVPLISTIKPNSFWSCVHPALVIGRHFVAASLHLVVTSPQLEVDKPYLPGL